MPPPAAAPVHHGQAQQHPPHAFRSGDRLPQDYRGRQHVVDNWHAHGLKKPPRGQHWVQIGVDYLLVRIGSNVIVSVAPR